MSNKKKSKKSVLLTILAVILCLIFSPFIDENTTPDTPKQNETNEPFISEGELKVHYIDVGQADSILVTLNDYSMLIDAGNNGDGDIVVEYLKKNNISKLNYLIGTHPHEDHIGGLDDVIYNFDLETVLMPKAQTNTQTFESVLDSLLAKKQSVTTPNVGDTYPFDSAEFTIVSVENENTGNLNESSIVIRLVYGEQSFIFCGDSEIPNEKKMLSSGLTIESDVIKVGHHGSDTSSSDEFIKAVNPEIAVICVGTDNKYEHPCQSTLDTLKKYDITVYRTDTNGTIIITSDGISNSVTCERS